MLLRRVLTALMVLLALAALAQALYWGPQLPERVASHFDFDDRVNGWMDRAPFLVLATVLPVAMAGLFLALSLLLDRIPDALINLPHKDYWLAPSRRAESLARATSGLLAIGCATLLLLLVLFQGTYMLNAGLPGPSAAPDAAGAAPQLAFPLPFFTVLGLYLATVAIVPVWMLRRFRRPPAQDAAPRTMPRAAGR